jgi:hypothetical protein
VLHLFRWDLTTNATANMNFVQATVPVADMIQVKVSFSCPTPEEITMVYWLQFASALELNSQGDVLFSYLNTK